MTSLQPFSRNDRTDSSSSAKVAMPVDINGNPIEGGEIEVTSPDGQAQVVTAIGPHSRQIRAAIRSPGIARLQLADKTNGLTALSNPIRVADSLDDHVYWGEFHWHGYDAVELNVLNDDTHPEKAFRYGRDVSRFEFALQARTSLGTHPTPYTSAGSCTAKRRSITTIQAAM